MTLFYFAVAPLLAAVLSFVLTPLVRRLAFYAGAIDKPGLRKVHLAEVPRLGGLAVIGASAAATAMLLWSDLSPVDQIARDLAVGLTLGLLPILLMSVLDDVRPLPASPKFMAQLVGASVAVSFGIRLGENVHILGQTVALGWLAVPVSLLWLVGVTNAFNIVDGLDGLSAGLALFSALTLAGVAVLVGQNGLAMLALVLAGALVGFLPYNVYPAKIFLGDSGATAIGFVLACLALRGGSTLSSGLAILAPILVLGLPIAETLVSMLRRLVRRLRGGGSLGMFEGDAGHFHHRLLALGLDQRRAVLVLYGAGLVISLAGFGSLFLSHKKAAVLLLTMLAAAVVGLSRLGYDEFAVLRRGDLLRMYDVPVLHKAIFVVFVDLALVVFSIYATFVLKYDDWGLAINRPGAAWLLTVLPPVTLAWFFAFRLYQRVWWLAGIEDMVLCSTAVTTAAGTCAVLSLLFNDYSPPVTWFAICYLVTLLGLNGSRASYRLLQDSWKRAHVQGEAVLIYGAGQAGSMVVKQMLDTDSNMRPVGFIDDNAAMAGKVFNGYPVLGTLQGLEPAIAQHAIKGLVVATYDLPAEQVLEAVHVCARSGIWMRHFRVSFEDGEGAARPLVEIPG